jgi:hypothetical protein
MHFKKKEISGTYPLVSMLFAVCIIQRNINEVTSKYFQNIYSYSHLTQLPT